MTTRLVDFIRKLSLLRPAREVALLTGASAKTVSGILTKYRQHLDKSVCFETPRVLGLDGVYARVEKEEQEGAAHGKKGSVKRKRRKTVKKECICVTDIEKGIAIDLWPHASKESIVNSLRRLPKPERIKVVVIDMSSVLYSAVREALPWAVIVIDIFHVQSKANVGVDNVRKRLRKGIRRVKGHPTMCPKELLRKHRDPRRPEKVPPELKGWFDLMPELRLAYEIKESFFDIWVSSCTRTALKRYQLWLEKFPPELRKDFSELLSALHNWKEEIFNYFDYPFTNGFTEGRNRLVKDIQRETRGCRFHTLRARLIYGGLLKKQLEEARQNEMALKKQKPRIHGAKKSRTPRCEGRNEESKDAGTSQGFAGSVQQIPCLQMNLF